MGTRPDGKTTLCIGKSRSGKSSLLKAIEALWQRSLAFDPKDEWTQLGFDSVDGRAELVGRLRESLGDVKLSYPAYDKKDFDFWAACAFNFNRQKQALLIAEELGSVAETGRAMNNWARLVNQGLGYGMTLVGTVQRGQEVDKTIINNSSAIYIFQHQTDTDVKSMAERIGVDMSEIPREPMQFIVWTPSKGIIITKGRVEYKNNVPVFTGVKKGGRGRPVKLTMLKDGTFKGVDYL